MTTGVTKAGSVLCVRDLGRQPYRPVYELQERLVDQRRRGAIPDTLLLVEHDPVYTVGRTARHDHVLLSAEERARWGIDLVQTNRGGDVTYHGPGQLVGYPILYLGASCRRVFGYVSRLESLLIRVLRQYGLPAERDLRHRGVWLGQEKIGAIGVRICGRITMHGFSLNVRVDLAAFRGIVPCGLHDRRVTSLHVWVPQVQIDAIKAEVIRAFAEEFGYDHVENEASGKPATCRSVSIVLCNRP